MNVVVVDYRGAEILEQSGKLVVRAGGERRATVPLRLVDRLLITGTGVVSTTLLCRLVAEGRGVLVVPPAPPNAVPAHLVERAADAALRAGQYRAADNGVLCMAIARELLARKIAGQAEVLAEARGGDRARLAETARRLDETAFSIGKTRDKALLLGIEGAAAAAFFAAYATLFAPSLGFEGRKRRPPPDPVNVALSLGYTLAHHEALVALARRGFDTARGFLHEPLAGRDSLACDLAEPLRPLVERFVTGLFGRDRLRPEHFTSADGACLLGKAGRRIYYENAAETLLPLLARQAADNAARLEKALAPEALP